MFGRFFTGQITAAGKVPPAKVFVIGAGVAGLAALGTAVSLGAIVRANDTRPEVADQVKSMGAEFVPVDYQEEGTGVGGYAKVMSEGFQKAQLATFAKQAGGSRHHHHDRADSGETGAEAHHRRDGAVDAAWQRDRRHGRRAGRQLRTHGAGRSRRARTASRSSATPTWRAGCRSRPPRCTRPTCCALTEELCKTKDGVINVNFDDEVIRGTTVIKAGEITWPPPPPRLSAAPPQAKPAATPIVAPKKSGHGHGAGEPASGKSVAIIATAGALLFWLVGAFAPASFLSHFTVFVLACFIGNMVIWNVKPSLHTPLMSVTNAISSIIAVGALIQVAPPLGR